MLRNTTVYQQSTLTPDKPVWHWSQLFTGPAYIGGMDIDFTGFHAGWQIVVETKPIGMRVSRYQSSILEQIAARPKTIVILAGTKQVEPDLFTTDRGIVVKWVQITADKAWRSPKWVINGNEEEFKDYIIELKRTIDLQMAPANDEHFRISA